MKKPSFHLLIRSYPNGSFVSAYLIRRDAKAGAEWHLLHGELIPQAAEELAEGLGLPVEREESPFTAVPLRPRGCVTVEEQQGLFPDTQEKP